MIHKSVHLLEENQYITSYPALWVTTEIMFGKNLSLTIRIRINPELKTLKFKLELKSKHLFDVWFLKSVSPSLFLTFLPSPSKHPLILSDIQGAYC